MTTLLTLTCAFLLGWLLRPRLQALAALCLAGWLLALWIPVWLTSVVVGFLGLLLAMPFAPARVRVEHSAFSLTVAWAVVSTAWVFGGVKRVAAWLEGNPLPAPAPRPAAPVREPASWDEDGRDLADEPVAPARRAAPARGEAPARALPALEPAVLLRATSHRWERALLQAGFEGRLHPETVTLEAVQEVAGGPGLDVAVVASISQGGDPVDGLERFLDHARRLVSVGQLERRWRLPAEGAE